MTRNRLKLELEEAIDYQRMLIQEMVVNYLKNNVSKNDIIMTLGAGTVTKIGPMLAD